MKVKDFGITIYDLLKKVGNKNIYVAFVEQWKKVDDMSIEESKKRFIILTRDIDTKVKINKLENLCLAFHLLVDDKKYNDYDIVVYNEDDNEHYNIKDIAEDIENCYTIGVTNE